MLRPTRANGAAEEAEKKRGGRTQKRNQVLGTVAQAKSRVKVAQLGRVLQCWCAACLAAWPLQSSVWGIDVTHHFARAAAALFLGALLGGGDHTLRLADNMQFIELRQVRTASTVTLPALRDADLAVVLGSFSRNTVLSKFAFHDNERARTHRPLWLTVALENAMPPSLRLRAGKTINWSQELLFGPAECSPGPGRRCSLAVCAIGALYAGGSSFQG